MDQRQTIEFPYSGLDTDSDEKQMLSGDSRNRRNCINDSTDDARLGDITNPKGTTLYAHTSPTGTNTTIGSCKDSKNKAIIYFVHNSLGNHHIRRFFPSSGTDQLIVQNSLLNFKLTNRIYHAEITNGLLYWTDGYFNSYMYDINGILDYNPPRKINIEKAFTGGYTTIDFEVLDRLKYPPPYPPTMKYGYDAALGYNYLYGRIYQFAYRYIYDDKEVSCWSTLSETLLPAFNYKNNNAFGIVENTIDVSILSGPEIVTDIEIATRINGSYFIISRLDKSELSIPNNTTYTYVYTGIALKENLLIEDYLRPYDYVPQVSKAMCIAGNRIMDGNIVEGYDKIDTDLTITYERYDKTTFIRETSLNSNSGFTTYGETWGNTVESQFPITTFKSEGSHQVGVLYSDRGNRTGDVNTKEEYISLVPAYDVGLFPFNGMMMDPLKMIVEVNHVPPDWADTYQIVLTKELTYKKKVQFAIGANSFESKDGTIEIPGSLGYTFDDGDIIKLVAYQIPTGGFETVNYPLFQTLTNLYQGNDGMLPWTFLPPVGSSFINGIVDQSSNTFSFHYKIQSFDSGTGKIKLLPFDSTDAKNYIFSREDNVWGSANKFYIVEIYNKNRDETENKIFFEVGKKLPIIDPYTPDRRHGGTTQNQIIGTQPAKVEIYGFDAYLREKEQSLSTIAFLYNFEFGIPGGSFTATPDLFTIPAAYLPFMQNLDLSECYPFDLTGFSVMNPVVLGEPTYDAILNRYSFPITGTMPSVVNFYGFAIFGTIKLKAWVEDANFADDYPSEVYNDGRPHTSLDTTERKQYISRIRFSEKIFENTLINGLSTVLVTALPPQELSEQYNEIYKMKNVGYTLKVRQQDKLSSFYVERNVYQDSQGQQQVMQSNQVLSAPNVYEEPFGTTIPGSDSQNGRLGYFFDLINGVIIRDAGNSPITISGNDENPKDPYKMSKFFRDLANNILQIGTSSFNIISCYDRQSSLYTLTIQDLRDGAPLSQTIVFHEPTNRWKSFMDYVPEWYETLGKRMVMFKNGQPNLAYTNVLRCNFLGVQYEQKMDFVVNLARNTPKIFENIDLCSNVAWEVTNVDILPTPNYPNGMASRIPKGKFVAKEGVWHASFLKDQNDPKYAGNVINGLLSGRRLRGQTMKVTMTNNETSLVYLQAINIYLTPSELII